MASATANIYDVLPYESLFNPLSHPDRLASMAALYGLNPPPVANCRVLELGCGVGGNVIGIAQSLPGAEVVGVDLSPRQVAEGQAVARELGLANATFHAMDLAKIDESFGSFDYIVCHGVYSWVADAVQARILELAAQRLTASGILFLSYNVYPGWFQRGTVRAAMLFHTRGITDPLERVARSRSFLEFLIASTTPQNTPYALALKHEAELLGKVSDTYLFHEHLEEENRPVYFHELAERAERAGLNYLGPARFSLLETGLCTDLREAFEGFSSDRIAREQYIDYVLNRSFRQSLFCLASAGAAPDPMPQGIPRLRFSAFAWPESTHPDVVSHAPEPFKTLLNDHVSLSLPRMKAALVALADRWPRSSGFEALRVESLNRLGERPEVTGAEPETNASAEVDRREFSEMLLEGVGSTLINTHVHEPEIAVLAGDRPRVTPLARRQAATGVKVVNLRQGVANLSELDRLVVSLLDGTRDRAAVVKAIAGRFLQGALQLSRDGKPVTDPAEVRTLLEEQVRTCLDRLAAEALLLA